MGRNPRPRGYSLYDTMLLEDAKALLLNVYNATKHYSERQVRLLGTVISKLSQVLDEYGDKEERRT